MINPLDALRKGPFKEPAHVWLYEVRNATGYRRTERYADALVLSVWPSRGLWLAGVEQKVSRNDWLRELKNPEKAEAIRKYCHFWWVVAPEGIIHKDEVPETWGLYEIKKGNKARKVKEAPRITPVPLDMNFIASLLRSQAKNLDRIIEGARAQGRDEYKERVSGAKSSEELQFLVRQRDAENARLRREVDSLTRNIRQFEKRAGLPDGVLGTGTSDFMLQKVADYYSTAVRLHQLDLVPARAQVKNLLNTMDHAIKELEALRK